MKKADVGAVVAVSRALVFLWLFAACALVPPLDRGALSDVRSAPKGAAEAAPQVARTSDAKDAAALRQARISRRFRDVSVRKEMVPLGSKDAVELGTEVLTRILFFYVDQINLGTLVARGLDELDSALDNPDFVAATHAEKLKRESIAAFRKSLVELREDARSGLPLSAREEVSALLALCRRTANYPAGAVAYEFAAGAASDLDPYSHVLSPDELNDMLDIVDGTLTGLGVVIEADERGILLTDVVPGGPAEEAGLRRGAHIVRVNGQSVVGVGIEQAGDVLLGAEGSAVDIDAILADGTHMSRRIVRRRVEIPSVAGDRIADAASHIGYVRLVAFQKTSDAELASAVTDLQRQGMQKLVLDLRGNPGGELHAAVDIGKRFIDDGVIMSTKGRAPFQSNFFDALHQAVWHMPLFVLVDRMSASAAEILSGALQENGRATVLGERTYGKGTVQSVFTLRSVFAGLKLTTAKFYSPKGRPYANSGVMPDVPLRMPIVRDAKGTPLEPFAYGDPEHDPQLEETLDYVRAH